MNTGVAILGGIVAGFGALALMYVFYWLGCKLFLRRK